MASGIGIGALASTAMSLSLGILEQLVAKGILSKEEALAMLDAIATAKNAKGYLYDSPDDAEAAQFLSLIRRRFEERVS